MELFVADTVGNHIIAINEKKGAYFVSCAAADLRSKSIAKHGHDITHKQ